LFLSVIRSTQVPEQDVVSPLQVPADTVVVTATGGVPVMRMRVPVAVTLVVAFVTGVVTGIAVVTTAGVGAPTHLPALQYCPLPQTFPHIPQLLESAAVFRQIPLHTVWPSAQETIELVACGAGEVFTRGEAPFEEVHPLASTRQIAKPAISQHEPGELIGYKTPERYLLFYK
jgi:hypothetical protein